MVVLYFSSFAKKRKKEKVKEIRYVSIGIVCESSGSYHHLSYSGGAIASLEFRIADGMIMLPKLSP